MTEKEALWRGVKTKCQNEDQRKTENTLADQKRIKDEEVGGRKALCYHISIITSPLSECGDRQGAAAHRRGNMGRMRKEALTEETERIWHLKLRVPLKDLKHNSVALIEMVLCLFE